MVSPLLHELGWSCISFVFHLLVKWLNVEVNTRDKRIDQIREAKKLCSAVCAYPYFSFRLHFLVKNLSSLISLIRFYLNNANWLQNNRFFLPFIAKITFDAHHLFQLRGQIFSAAFFLHSLSLNEQRFIALADKMLHTETNRVRKKMKQQKKWDFFFLENIQFKSRLQFCSLSFGKAFVSVAFSLLLPSLLFGIFLH